MTKEDVLQQCTIEGMVVKLPKIQLERKLYQDVAKSLELIGGKWKGERIAGFVFEEDPTEMLSDIAVGNNRNLKKEFQCFFTPMEIAKDIVRAADLKKGQRILEPSAGSGNLLKAIYELHPEIKQVDCCEILHINQMRLEKIDGVHIISDDFLSLEHFENYYDRVIANPPFSNNQDIDHIRKMFECVKPGGKIVTLSSTHWQVSNNKKEKQFAAWLYDELEADINCISAGAFAKSGTNIETFLIEITKPLIANNQQGKIFTQQDLFS